ncbi:MAG: TonB-dependent receptor domain-containing protein [Pseudomonadota bacterium]
MSTKTSLSRTTALATLSLIAAAPLAGAMAQQLPMEQVADDQVAVEEIVVTGSYIRRKTQFDSPSPIQVVGSEQLETLGVSTIAELTQTLTVNNGAQNNSDAFTQNLTTGTENINLRGLGVQSTLVLLNGRRQVGSAAPTDGGLNFVDTASLVPMIAVDRVEILKDGAAALYGTDAVAGVVNFITRDDFEGLELNADFQSVTEKSSSDLRVSGLWGAGDDRTHFVVAASYFNRTELSSRERDLRRGAEGAPYYLSVSSNTAFPPNFVVPSSQFMAATNNPLLPAFTQAFDGFTPFIAPGQLNLVPGVDGNGNPTMVFGGFLPAPDSIADGLTTAVLASLGVPQALALAGLNPSLIMGQIQAQIVARQQAALAAGQQSTFNTPFVPDPNCATIAQNFEDDTQLLPPQVGNSAAGISAIGALGQCSLDFGPYFSVIPDEERIQGYTKLTHQLTDAVEIFAEFSYARNRAERNTSNFPITSPFTIPAINPFNPFGPGTIVIGRSPGNGQLNGDFFTDRPNPNFFKYDTYRVSAGAHGDLSDTWYFDLAFTRGVNDYRLRSTDGVRSKTLLALAGLGGEGCDPATGIPGVGPCQFYNIFGSGFIADPNVRVPVLNPQTFQPLAGPDGNPILVPVRNSNEILQFIVSDIIFENTSKLNVFDAVVSGDLFDMPAGTAGLAVGFQYRDESLSSDLDADTNAGDRLFVTQPTADFNASRNVWAFFTELNLPLMDNLELNGALRYENYSGNVGDTLDPKVSILYRPVDSLTLRGSWGTSFRAPSLFQTFGNQTTLNSVRDPFGGQPFIAIRTEGNEELRPETSSTYNLGATFEPAEGLEFSVDFWSFNFDNVISEIPADSLALFAAAGAPLPSFGDKQAAVIRNASTGGLLTITTLFTNDNQIKTNGLDFSVAYTLDVGNAGVLRFGVDGTYVNKYSITGFDGITVSGAGRTNRLTFADPVPELRTNFSALWVKGGHQGALFVRRIGGMLDDRNTIFAELPPLAPGLPGLPDLTQVVDPVRVSSMTTLDLQYSYTFEAYGPLQGAQLTIGAINLLDKAPPFVRTDGGFESRTYDPRGRLLYVRTKFNF